MARPRLPPLRAQTPAIKLHTYIPSIDTTSLGAKACEARVYIEFGGLLKDQGTRWRYRE